MSKAKTQIRWTKDEFERVLAIDHIRRHLIRQGLINEKGQIIPLRSSSRLSSSTKHRVMNRERRCRSAMDRQSIIVHGRSSAELEEVEPGRRSKLTNASNARSTPKRTPSRSPSPARSFVLSNNNEKIFITMIYYGPSLMLNCKRSRIDDQVDEILVTQQHCGGENLVVYRGHLKSNDLFRFESRRHPNYPFALTFYINGLVDHRLSICCEWRHRSNVRLGGKRGLFGIVQVQNPKACQRCQQMRRRTRSAAIKPRPISLSRPPSEEDPVQSQTELSD